MSSVICLSAGAGGQSRMEPKSRYGPMPTQAWQLCWLFGGKWKTQDEKEDVGGAHLLSGHLTSCLLSPSHTRFLLVSRTCQVLSSVRACLCTGCSLCLQVPSSLLPSSHGPPQKGFLPKGTPRLLVKCPPSSTLLVSFLALIIIYNGGTDLLTDPFFPFGSLQTGSLSVQVAIMAPESRRVLPPCRYPMPTCGMNACV